MLRPVPSKFSLFGLIVLLPTICLAQNPADAVPGHMPIGMKRSERAQADGRPQFQVPRFPINAALPTLWLIGDSTVRNGSYEDGDNGQWGWGNPIRHYFDETKINVQNRAVGGTSSRSFQAQHWAWILKEIKPGDYLVMQFGHNDAGTPKGNGDEVIERPVPTLGRRGARGAATQPAEAAAAPATAPMESVHTFGWYMRKYVTDAKERGATAIICTPIPRNRWTGTTITPDAWDTTLKEAAEVSGARFVDLNGIIISKYTVLGQQKVTDELFPANEAVHTDWAGAILNAECIIEGLKSIDSPVVKYLKPQAPKDLTNPWGKAR